MAKVIHNKPECIGCGTCAALCPKYWEMDYDNNKANLLKSKEISGSKQERKIDKKDMESVKEAAEACPAGVIEVKD